MHIRCDYLRGNHGQFRPKFNCFHSDNGTCEGKSDMWTHPWWWVHWWMQNLKIEKLFKMTCTTHKVMEKWSEKLFGKVSTHLHATPDDLSRNVHVCQTSVKDNMHALHNRYKSNFHILFNYIKKHHRYYSLHWHIGRYPDIHPIIFLDRKPWNLNHQKAG